jgi:hypothetical protein
MQTDRTTSLVATDSFTSRFLARVPQDVAATFTPEQLRAVRAAFGMRYVADHAIDARGLVNLPWGRFYVVFLAGREARRDHGDGVVRRLGRRLLDGAACVALACVAVALVLAWLDGGTTLIAASGAASLAGH